MPITEGRTWNEYVWQSSTEENIWTLEKRTRGWRQPNKEFGNFNYNTRRWSVWGWSWSTRRKYPATHSNRLKNTTPQGGQNSNLYLWHRTVTAWKHEWMEQNSWACICYLCLIIIIQTQKHETVASLETEMIMCPSANHTDEHKTFLYCLKYNELYVVW